MAKYSAKSTLLQYESATGPSVFSTVPCIGDFDFPLVGQRDEIDVTNHDSAGDYEETLLGIIRTQEISLPVVAWDGASTHHAAMVTRAAAGTLTNFKVTTKDTKVHTFAGYVKGVNLSNPVNGALSATLVIKPTGAITTV